MQTENHGVFTCAGEFGSVREAFLKTEDSSVQKVAVKVLKCELYSSSSSSSSLSSRCVE